MAIEVIVGNKKHGARGEYVGRPSPLGNPFSHLSGTLARFRVATRDEAVEKYAEWLHARIDEGGATDESMRVIGELYRLAGLAQRGPLTLVCWCAPARCHAEVIREIVLEWAAGGVINGPGLTQAPRQLPD